ncbi:MAG: hypothetical protein OHK0052_06420 [Anaerolineales bacterium]
MLTSEERAYLLRLARQAVEIAARGESLPPLALNTVPERLREPGCAFVTLTIQGELRGCIGALEAYQPLAEDVFAHAYDAARNDYRFPAVTPAEVARIQIEVSRLTTPVELHYTAPAELLSALRPGVDGVTLRDGSRRATFLPQVWEKLPAPADFLRALCQKMGAQPNLWERKILQVSTYQVEAFCEGEP